MNQEQADIVEAESSPRQHEAANAEAPQKQPDTFCIACGSPIQGSTGLICKACKKSLNEKKDDGKSGDVSLSVAMNLLMGLFITTIFIIGTVLIAKGQFAAGWIVTAIPQIIYTFFSKDFKKNRAKQKRMMEGADTGVKFFGGAMFLVSEFFWPIVLGPVWCAYWAFRWFEQTSHDYQYGSGFGFGKKLADESVVEYKKGNEVGISVSGKSPKVYAKANTAIAIWEKKGYTFLAMDEAAYNRGDVSSVDCTAGGFQANLAYSVGRVEESNNPEFEKGDLVRTSGSFASGFLGVMDSGNPYIKILIRLEKQRGAN